MRTKPSNNAEKSQKNSPPWMCEISLRLRITALGYKQRELK